MFILATKTSVFDWRNYKRINEFKINEFKMILI